MDPVTNCCSPMLMYPADKVDTSQHLATPRFPQGEHTVSEPIVDAGSLTSSHPQMSASHLLGLQVRANEPSYNKAKQ